MPVQVLLRRFAQISAAFSAIFLLASIAQAVDLRKDLSAEEFKAAGLYKLARAELEELERLIVARPAQTPPANRSPTENQTNAIAAPVASENSPDWRPAPEESDRRIIETEVTNAFKGLFGASKIVLANGQVWQQTDKAVFDRKLRDKRVRIKPAMLGRWRLQFIDNNLSFTVKRVQ